MKAKKKLYNFGGPGDDEAKIVARYNKTVPGLKEQQEANKKWAAKYLKNQPTELQLAQDKIDSDNYNASKFINPKGSYSQPTKENPQGLATGEAEMSGALDDPIFNALTFGALGYMNSGLKGAIRGGIGGGTYGVSELPGLAYGLGKGTLNYGKQGILESFHPVDKELFKISNQGKKAGLSDFEIAQKQMDKVGITSNQRQAYIPGVSDVAEKYITPYGYVGDGGKTKLQQTLDNIRGKTNVESHITVRQGEPRADAFSLYLGKPQKHNTYEVANTAPLDKKIYPAISKDMDIYSFKNTEQNKLSNLQPRPDDTMYPLDILKKERFYAQDNGPKVMGGFNGKLSSEGMQYNDIWDLQPEITLKSLLPQKLRIDGLKNDFLNKGLNKLIYSKNKNTGVETPRGFKINVDNFVGKSFMSHGNLPFNSKQYIDNLSKEGYKINEELLGNYKEYGGDMKRKKKFYVFGSSSTNTVGTPTMQPSKTNNTVPSSYTDDFSNKTRSKPSFDMKIPSTNFSQSGYIGAATAAATGITNTVNAANSAPDKQAKDNAITHGTVDTITNVVGSVFPIVGAIKGAADAGKAVVDSTNPTTTVKGDDGKIYSFKDGKSGDNAAAWSASFNPVGNVSNFIGDISGSTENYGRSDFGMALGDLFLPFVTEGLRNQDAREAYSKSIIPNYTSGDSSMKAYAFGGPMPVFPKGTNPNNKFTDFKDSSFKTHKEKGVAITPNDEVEKNESMYRFGRTKKATGGSSEGGYVFSHILGEDELGNVSVVPQGTKAPKGWKSYADMSREAMS